jgi:serpin B
LPEEGHFAAIEEQLSAGFLDEVRQRAELRDVTLSMPRLDFETALDLSGLLQAMGMTDAFGGAADFSGMVEGGGLFISAALHRATITVDEKGTEAAAATLVAMAESALQQVTLTIDRPFVFATGERETGTILFLGRVMNPVAG